MITRTYTLTDDDFPQGTKSIREILDRYPQINHGLFFDIETTGFSPQKNALYLIGCGWYEQDRWQIIQWMAKNPSEDEQRLVLKAFMEKAADFSTLITYNGSTFDLPFIEKKYRSLKSKPLDQPFALSHLEHLDLYKKVRPLKNLLGIENQKLKSIERFLGIFRDDQYSGGALIPIYEAYAKTGNDALEKLLLLHNYEDIKDMLFILPMLSYAHFIEGGFSIAPKYRVDSKRGTLTLWLIPHSPLPSSHKDLQALLPQCSRQTQTALWPLCLSCTAGHGDFDQEKYIYPLTLPLYYGECKYFYGDYKNYYYLPLEDYAIHKSIADFVDKANRQRATAKTCYTKKAGVFLPQPEEIITPAFKIQYEDSLSWFLFTPELLENGAADKNAFKAYICSLLRLLSA